MDITTVKTLINEAFNKEGYNLKYEDLFTLLDRESEETRVKNKTLFEFEKELEEYLKSGRDFLIYIQIDDAPYIGAECNGSDSDLWEEAFDEDCTLIDSIHSFKGEPNIYILID